MRITRPRFSALSLFCDGQARCRGGGRRALHNRVNMGRGISRRVDPATTYPEGSRPNHAWGPIHRSTLCLLPAQSLRAPLGTKTLLRRPGRNGRPSPAKKKKKKKGWKASKVIKNSPLHQAQT